jgi:magnesium-transporting ATPase (P-type)
LLTFVAVLVSRLINFLPGFIVVLFLSESIFNATTDTVKHQQRAALRGLVSIVLVIVTALLLAVPVDLLLGNLLAQTNNATAQTAAVATGLVESLILTVYLVALEHAFFKLLPSRFTLGSRLFDLNRVLWGASFALITFLLLSTIINPALSGVDVFRLPAVIVIGLLLLIASAIALGAWLRVSDKQWQGDKPQNNRLLISAVTLLVMWVFVCGCAAIYLITRIGK